MCTLVEKLHSAGEVYVMKTGAPLPAEGYLVDIDSWGAEYLSSDHNEFIQRCIEDFSEDEYEYGLRFSLENEQIKCDYFMYYSDVEAAKEDALTLMSTVYDIANQAYLEL